MLILRRRLSRLLSAWSVSPLLYLIAFGYAMGKNVTAEHLPGWAQKALILLPLTHAADAIRAASFGAVPQPGDYFILVGIGCATIIFAILAVNKARD